MKSILLLLLWSFSMGITAQELRTLYANEKQVVALFFPHPIRQAVVGSEKFTFSYNKERPQYVGLLQGNIAPKSNLLVLTENGDVFSFLVAYKKTVDTLTYFIKEQESIGRERPIEKIVTDTLTLPQLASDSLQKKLGEVQLEESRYQKACTELLQNNRNSLRKRRKNGLLLHLRDLVYQGTEVFVLLEIKNRSGIDLEMDYLKIFKENGNNRRRASYQKMALPPVYRHDFPHAVKDRQKATFALVLPKFTLGDSERVLLELKELRGNRILRMRYP